MCWCKKNDKYHVWVALTEWLPLLNGRVSNSLQVLTTTPLFVIITIIMNIIWYVNNLQGIALSNTTIPHHLHKNWAPRQGYLITVTGFAQKMEAVDVVILVEDFLKSNPVKNPPISAQKCKAPDLRSWKLCWARWKRKTNCTVAH